MSHGRDYTEQRFSPLINTDNVSQLGLAWYGDFDTNRGQESTPVEVDGVVYVSTAWSKVYAYDVKSGSPAGCPSQTGSQSASAVRNRRADRPWSRDMQPLLRHLSRHRGQSRGLFPDLRYSGALASQEVFNSIVLDGALTRNGMVSFSKALTPEDVYDLRAYPTSRPLDAQKNGSGGMFPGQPARGASAQAANSPPAHQIGHLEATH